MLKITVKVEGMMCPMCEAHVNEAIRNAMKLKSVESSHKTGETVIISESADEEAIRAAIENTGYKVLGITSEEYGKKGFFAKLFNR